MHEILKYKNSSFFYSVNLKLQSVSFASVLPSMFENLELQLLVELSSVPRGCSEEYVLLSVNAPVWMFTILHNHRF